MAGVYVHIPFCKSRCKYCDFYSTTLLGRRGKYVDAVMEEWAMSQEITQTDKTKQNLSCATGAQTAKSIHLDDARRIVPTTLATQVIETIYIGGGTPSLLEVEDMRRLLEVLPVASAKEVTIEANPSDITHEKAKAWKAMGVNRLSIGIQSFNDDMLRLIGRRHTAEQAREAVRIAREEGFENISVDLIYGLPHAMRNAKCVMRNAQCTMHNKDKTEQNLATCAQTTNTSNVDDSMSHIALHIHTVCAKPTADEASASPATMMMRDAMSSMEVLKRDVEELLWLDVEHISTYCLSYEEGTAITRMLEHGEIEEVDEDTENRMFDYIVEQLTKAGYEHYEVSNFARPGRRSRHNSSYWNDTPYIGLGAGAHSYDGVHRYWNPSDIDLYIKGALAHDLQREQETLTDEQRHTERVMLGLRIAEGIAQSDVDEAKALPYLRRGLLREEGDHLVATTEGYHILNRIIEDLI